MVDLVAYKAGLRTSGGAWGVDSSSRDGIGTGTGD